MLPYPLLLCLQSGLFTSVFLRYCTSVDFSASITVTTNNTLCSLTSNNTKCGKINTGMLKRGRRLGKSRHTREYNTKVDTKEKEIGIDYSCRLKEKKKQWRLGFIRTGNFLTQRAFGFREWLCSTELQFKLIIIIYWYRLSAAQEIFHNMTFNEYSTD